MVSGHRKRQRIFCHKICGVKMTKNVCFAGHHNFTGGRGRLHTTSSRPHHISNTQTEKMAQKSKLVNPEASHSSEIGYSDLKCFESFKFQSTGALQLEWRVTLRFVGLCYRRRWRNMLSVQAFDGELSAAKYKGAMLMRSK